MKNKNLFVSVVILSLNEQETLGTCIERLQHTLKVLGFADETSVADNDSTADSAAIAERLGTYDEHALIRCTQQGDTEAFNPIGTKYQYRIYTVIQRQVRNPETAKDLCQETFLKAYLAINAFRGDSAFYSWIYRIAKNVCIDFQRKQQAEYDIDPLHAVDERRILNTHPDPGDILQKQELRQILRSAIQLLPPIRKRVFFLRYSQQLPIKEIAVLLNKSEGTIKTHLYKAHHQLRELLTPYLKNKDIPWLVS